MTDYGPLAGELGDIAEGEYPFVFDLDGCECEHSPGMHDDGFGCTVRNCECLAGWSI